MNIGYRHLKALVTLADAGTLAETARKLYITQPAVWALLRSLGEDLGTPLAVREGRGMRLTAVGEKVLPFARQAVEAIDAMSSQVRSEASEVPELRIATSSVPGRSYLPELMREYLGAFPDCRLHVQWVKSQEAIGLVRCGEADIGLTGMAPDPPDMLERTLGVDELWLVAPPRHRILGTPCGVQELQHETWVMRPRGSGTRGAIEEALAARGLDPKRLQEVAVADSNEGVLALVASGLGLAFVSRAVAEPAVTTRQVEWVEACDFKIRRQIHLVGSNPPTPAAERFFAWLQAGKSTTAPPTG